MTEQSDDPNIESKNAGKKDSISIIYHQRNDSPKYFEIKRTSIYLLFIGLPTITLIALVIGTIGLIHTSPFHLIESYRQNSKARSQIANREELEEKAQVAIEENNSLKEELKILKEQAQATPTSLPASTTASGEKCPALTCPPVPVAGTINSIGLSTLSLFKPIQNQKDRTRPAVLNLSGFKATMVKDMVNLQFNIIPTIPDDAKISGHIVVLMKNELGISAYPLQAFGGSDFQINYSAGETFSTQRFRPVDASFVKPRKSGNYFFTVFIFARNGDLIHYQSTTLPLNL